MSKIEQFIEALRRDEEYGPNIQHLEVTEATEAKYVAFPDDLHEDLQKALRSKGI